MLQVTSVDVTIKKPGILCDSQVGKQKVEALLKNYILQVFHSFAAGRFILYKAIYIVYLCIVYDWKKMQVNEHCENIIEHSNKKKIIIFTICMFRLQTTAYLVSTFHVLHIFHSSEVCVHFFITLDFNVHRKKYVFSMQILEYSVKYQVWLNTIHSPIHWKVNFGMLIFSLFFPLLFFILRRH